MGGKKKNQIVADPKQMLKERAQNKINEQTEKPPTTKKLASRWRSYGSKSQDDSQAPQANDFQTLKSRLPWRTGRRCSADQVSPAQALRRPSITSPLPPSTILEDVVSKGKQSRRRYSTPNGALASGISIVLQNAFLNTAKEYGPNMKRNSKVDLNLNNNGTGGGKSKEQKKENSAAAPSEERRTENETIMENEELELGDAMSSDLLKSGSTGSWETINNVLESANSSSGWYPAEQLLKTKYSALSKPTHRVSYRKAIQKAGYNMNELALTNTPSVSPMVTRKTEPKSKVDWGESAVIGEHIWTPSSQTGDLCYVGESQCTKSGPRRKCSACHIVVHESCVEQLDKIGFQCKVAFREASTRNLRENLIVRHHWVHRRRQEGKCKHCGKVFEKRFGFRDSKILAISCSWCKEAYHNKVSCFRMQKINEPCTLGLHARIIVPPMWVVKWTPRGKSIRNRSKKKRGSSGMWRKKSSREGRQRVFVIRPLPEHTPYLSPTIVFINPKSGGNQGVKLMQTFEWLLNPRQVFNLSEGGPKEALEMFRKVPNLRILACGGDGTVGWILAVLDELNMTRMPPVAILPIGTGNDLSRTLNWGPGYTDEPISKILQHVEEGKVVQLDRWKLSVEPNLDVKQDDEGIEPPGACADGGVDQPPLDVINNYFSLGADAKVQLEFHESREAHPSKFNSRFGNKFFYARVGVSDYLTSKQKNLGKIVSIVCDGRDITPRIRAFKPVCILFLNIPRYSAGTSPWGHPTGSEFHPQMHDDKLIEVLAFSSNQLGMLFVGGHGERLGQCREAIITTTQTCPMQIDGEPCRLNPSKIRLSFHNQANMIYKSKHRGSIPLIPDSLPFTSDLCRLPICDQQKICINVITTEQYEKNNGDKHLLRDLSRPSHTTVVPSDADLATVRLSIERIQQQDSTQTDHLSDQFTFLDLSGSDRFYRIDRTQESLHPVRDVVSSDGELYVLDAPNQTKSKVTNKDLESALTLAQFPRSNHVDRTTRRRIQSDTTGNRQNSLGDRVPSRAPDLIMTSTLKEVETPNEQSELSVKSPGHKDISTTVDNDVTKTPEIAPDDATKDNPNENFPSAVSHKPIVPESKEVNNSSKGRHAISEAMEASGMLLEPSSGQEFNNEMKSNSLPANLTKKESDKDMKRRPLSYSSRDDDATISNSSKQSHCDAIKAESFASVFSSPASSKNNSPKNIQDSNPALWNSTPSSVSTSSNEYLVTAGEGETSPPVTVVSANELTSSPHSPASSSPSHGSPHSQSHASLTTDLQKPSVTSLTIKVTEHEMSDKIPAERKISSSSEKGVEIQNPLSRKGNTRSTVSAIPSQRQQSTVIKSRSNTTAGMPLSVFVKTQTAPPTEKLVSPMKKKLSGNISASPDLEKQRALTLNEFVSSFKDVPENDEMSSVTDTFTDATVSVATASPDLAQNASASIVAKLHASHPSSATSPGGGASSLPVNGSSQSEVINGNQSNNKLENEADIQKLNKQCSDASKRGDLNKLKRALENGAELVSLDADGSTALHNAARFNHVEIARFLIEKGPAELINMKDRDRQQTALHKSAWFGHKAVCNLLVNAGASLTATDYKGMTPLERAKQAEDTKLVDYLSQEIAKRRNE